MTMQPDQETWEKDGFEGSASKGGIWEGDTVHNQKLLLY